MRNIVVVSRAVVSRQDLRSLVEELGGRWDFDPEVDQGVVEESGGVVYISGDTSHEGEYDPEEITLLQEALGERPRSVVDIHIGHADGSAELAQRIAREIIRRWTGFLDNTLDEISEQLHDRNFERS